MPYPLLIPLFALMIPIIVILTKHQQKMAEIMHRTAGDEGQIAALRQEIAELRALVHQQAITLDNISQFQKSLNAPPVPNVVDRLSTS